jgi:heme-degrading monooxygenase HmoA
MPELERAPGFRGALVMRSPAAGDAVEIRFHTFWDSIDAIRAFAGDDATRAVVSPEAEACLLHGDDRVRHWDVVMHRPID